MATPVRGVTAAAVRALVILLALVLAAASSRSVASGQPVRGWPAFRDGAVELSHPPGWSVARDASTGRLVVRGGPDVGLVIWPFFVNGGLDTSAAGQVLARMAASQAPRVVWTPAQPVGRSALRTDGRDGARVAAASLAWTASPRGTAVRFLLASAPGARRREIEESFAKILASVRLSGQPETPGRGGAPGPAGVSFVPFRDPSEDAFTLDVPRGWRVAGGLVRKAPVDVRSSVVASSPDNRIHLRIGDVDLPTFALPTPQLRQLGFHEGSPYSPGYGVDMVVMRHLPGEQFARHWVTTRVARTCAGIQVVSSQPLPRTVQAMNAIMARHGSSVMTQRLHAGDAAFHCQQGPVPMVGYLFVTTLLTAGGDGGGIWNVDQLQGYLSAAESAGRAQAILAHMIASVRLNPAWVRMQQNVTAATSSIVADTSAHIARVIGDSYWSRQASQDEIGRKRSNQILGVEDVRDTATGRELQVESGSNYYWIDHRGNIVGTNVHNRPSLDFRELVRLP